MSGAAAPRSIARCAISGTAFAAASLLTVMRTSCEPAAAKDAIWLAVDEASAVSVFVIDCTTIGCAEPIGTSPTKDVTVVRRDLKTKEDLGEGRVKNIPEPCP